MSDERRVRVRRAAHKKSRTCPECGRHMARAGMWMHLVGGHGWSKERAIAHAQQKPNVSEVEPEPERTTRESTDVPKQGTEPDTSKLSAIERRRFGL